VKNIVTRTLTGIVFIAIIIASICFSVYTFLAVFLLVSIVGLTEFYKLAASEIIKPQRIIGIIFGSLLFISVALYAHGVLNFKWVWINLFFAFLIFIIELYRKKENPFGNIAYTLLGIFYIVIPLSILNFYFSPFQFRGEFNTHILIAFFTITWLVDTAAYLVGMAIGRHRLFERISPKKSWEGSIGGFFMGIITAWVISLIFKDLLFYQWAIIAAIITVTGGFGDLVESMFKRSVNTKDTGSVLPGHGGILDRFDCVFFSAPLVYLYIYCFITNSL
jgi:phosphatidate cytidylyltransferase